MRRIQQLLLSNQWSCPLSVGLRPYCVGHAGACTQQYVCTQLQSNGLGVHQHVGQAALLDGGHPCTAATTHGSVV